MTHISRDVMDMQWKLSENMRFYDGTRSLFLKMDASGVG